MDKALQDMLAEMSDNKPLYAESPNRLKALFKLLPFSNSILTVVDKTSTATSNIVAGASKTAAGVQQAAGQMKTAADSMERAVSSANVATALSRLQFVFVAVNVVVTPIAFFLYFDKYDKAHYTFTNASKFTYAVATLALVGLSIAFPPIAVLTAGIGFAAAVTAIGNHFYKTNRVSKLLESATKDSNTLNKELDDIALEAKALAKDTNPDTKKIQDLYKTYNEKRTRMQHKINHKQSLTVQNKALSQKRGLVDKLFAVSVAAVAFIGMLVATFVPAVGLLMLAGVGVAGFGYMVGRFVQEVIGAKRSNKSKKEKDGESPQMGHTTDRAHSVEDRAKNEQKAVRAQGSTATINQLMSQDNGLQASLNQHKNENELIKKEQKGIQLIDRIISPKNEADMQAAAIQLMCAIGKHISDYKRYDINDIKEFVEAIPRFDETRPKLKAVVADIAKGAIFISEEQVAVIKQIPKAAILISEYGEKVNRIDTKEILSEVENFLNNSDFGHNTVT